MTTALATPPTHAPNRSPARWQGFPKRNLASGRQLPQYLSPKEVEALIRQAPHASARLLMLCQWRAGLRVSEALALRPACFSTDGEQPVLLVARGKGGKPRMVPVHPELEAALRVVVDYRPPSDRLFTADPATAWRWVQSAYAKAVALNQITPGRRVGTHTLRHSAARHWLASGVPINVVSRWLGHATITTTLLYLEILPDPSGYMERVA